MPDGSQPPHPEDLYSDLDVLVEMAKDAHRDEEAIRRQLESLKQKLDRFTQRLHAHSGGGGSAT